MVKFTTHSIQAWKNANTLRGLRVFYDEAEFTHGKAEDEGSAIFFVGKGERITEAVIYGGYIDNNGTSSFLCYKISLVLYI